MRNKLTISNLKQLIFLFLLSLAVVASPLSVADTTVEVEDNTEERIYLQHAQASVERRVKPSKSSLQDTSLSFQGSFYIVDSSFRVPSYRLYILYKNLRYYDSRDFTFS